MTKAELVDQVATTGDLSKSQTETVLTQCLQAIMDALQAGESVELRGFGRLQLRHRAAHQPQAVVMVVLVGAPRDRQPVLFVLDVAPQQVV